MSTKQIVTWCKYTQIEKMRFKARDRRRRMKRRWLKEQVFSDIYNGRKPNPEYIAALGWPTWMAESDRVPGWLS